MRVPGVMWWPGTIEAGRVEPSIGATVDMLPTMLNLAGVSLPERTLDGHDISGVLMGDGQRADAEYHYFHYEAMKAYRSGKWKIHQPLKGKIFVENPTDDRGIMVEHDWVLFDLEADPGESKDLSAEYPEVLARLQAERTAFLEGMGPLPERKH